MFHVITATAEVLAVFGRWTDAAAYQTAYQRKYRTPVTIRQEA